MSRAFSLHLDALRLLAALAVLASHWAYPRFTGGDHIWMRQHDLGGDGVGVFFVLSGLLIAYAADRRREEGLGGFALARASRLWSVALPAIAITVVLDAVGTGANPAFYATHYQGDHMALRALAAVSFTNELWFAGVRPGSNGPWWSLGYEAWYYAIFAALVFGRGRARWVWAGLLALIAGPRTWLLAPAWIMGVAAWRMIAAGAHRRIGAPAALALAAGAPALYALAHLAALPARLQVMTYEALGPAYGLLGFSDTFVWALLLAALVTLHLAGMAALLDRQGAAAPAWLDRAVHWGAGGSFALYLLHYPVLQLAGATLPGGVHDPLRQAALLVLALGAAYGAAELTERRRAAFHRALSAAAGAAGRLWRARRPEPA